MKDDILEVANHCLFTSQLMPPSHRKSYIILIFKKGDTTKLANYRPISLLCADFKIITKALANRLKHVLSTILHNSQSANVPGRSGFHNLFMIRDTIEYCNRFDINAYLISIDMEKAFDKVNRDFLYKVLERMNFGPTFISFIKTIYTEITAHVMINGYISMVIHLLRCLKQGCPLASMLFNIYVEPLAQAIRDDPKIHGIPVPGGEDNLASLFADDGNYFLSVRTSLHHFFHIFERFRLATGSTINHQKTKGLYIGQPNKTDPDLSQVMWTNLLGGLLILGIYFLDTFKKTRDRNWPLVIKNVDDHVNTLKQRSLSFKGKVLILNTVSLAMIWYLATVIPMTHDHESKIKKIIFEFLWKSSYNLIANETAYQPKTLGGVGIKCPLLQQMALQLKFFKNIIDSKDHSNWLTLPRYWLGYHLAPLLPEAQFLRSNLVPKLDTPMNTITLGFTKKQKRPAFYETLYTQLRMVDVANTSWLTPDIYKEFLDKRYKPPKAYTEHWSFHRYDKLLIWKFTYLTYSEGIHQDVYFRYLHIKLPTSYLIKKDKKAAGIYHSTMITSCMHCPNKTENQYHVIQGCIKAKPIWDHVYPTVTEILKTHSYKLPDLICGKFPPNVSDSKKKMVLTLIQITMHCIWHNRNAFVKNDPILPTLKGSKSIIRNTFHNVIYTKFMDFYPNKIEKFQKLFCHTPKVCRYDENEELLYTVIIKRPLL